MKVSLGFHALHLGYLGSVNAVYDEASILLASDPWNGPP